MKPFKLLVAVTAAAAMGCALAAPASARVLGIDEEAWAAGTARVDFTGGIGTVECQMLLTRALHSVAIPKVVSSLIGWMARADIPVCTRGGATVLRETLPWHIQYQSYTGTLPNITRVSTKIIGMTVTIREPTFGVICSARSTAAEPVIETYNLAAGGAIVSHTYSGTIRTSCGNNGTIGGTGNVVVPEGNRIHLI